MQARRRCSPQACNRSPARSNVAAHDEIAVERPAGVTLFGRPAKCVPLEHGGRGGYLSWLTGGLNINAHFEGELS